MNLYEAIFSRKSVRKFRMEPVDAEFLAKLRKFLDNISPLDNQSRVEFEIIDNLEKKQKVKGLWKTEAPYYLAVYCGEERLSARNAGYAAEQAVLYMTEKEVGSCYLGATKAGEPVKNGLKQFLVIAFGYPEGRLYRDSMAAHRLSLANLCTYNDEPGENLKSILKAARLAPSSFNSQPWRFIVYSDRVYIFARKDALPQTKRLLAMREFNIGIMLCHVMLAAEELWMNMETVTEDQFLKKVYKNGEYICTIVFHI